MSVTKAALLGPQLDGLKVKVSLKPMIVFEPFLWTRKQLKKTNRGFQLYAKEVHVKFHVYPIGNKFMMPDVFIKLSNYGLTKRENTFWDRTFTFHLGSAASRWLSKDERAGRNLISTNGSLTCDEHSIQGPITVHIITILDYTYPYTFTYYSIFIH